MSRPVAGLLPVVVANRHRATGTFLAWGHPQQDHLPPTADNDRTDPMRTFIAATNRDRLTPPAYAIIPEGVTSRSPEYQDCLADALRRALDGAAVGGEPYDGITFTTPMRARFADVQQEVMTWAHGQRRCRANGWPAPTRV